MVRVDAYCQTCRDNRVFQGEPSDPGRARCSVCHQVQVVAAGRRTN